jgi:hypothetical protein
VTTTGALDRRRSTPHIVTDLRRAVTYTAGQEPNAQHDDNGEIPADPLVTPRGTERRVADR